MGLCWEPSVIEGRHCPQALRRGGPAAQCAKSLAARENFPFIEIHAKLQPVFGFRNGPPGFAWMQAVRQTGAQERHATNR